MTTASSPALGERFTRALNLAFELHAGQTRKGSGVPYFGHLLGVTSIVIETGASEDEAIAAHLHDAAEDQGGREILGRIRTEFGDPVADDRGVLQRQHGRSKTAMAGTQARLP